MMLSSLWFSNGRESGSGTPAAGSPAGRTGGTIGREIHRVITSHAEAAKIGRKEIKVFILFMDFSLQNKYRYRY
jgi:hypothetical protein